MSRLIDADVLVKIIDKHTNDENQLDDDITCILEEVPTAYDVDKVVKELKAKMKNIYGLYNRETPILESLSRKDAFNNGICEAIEIVKDGGVNE